MALRVCDGDSPARGNGAGVEVRAFGARGEEGGPHGLVNGGDADSAPYYVRGEGDGPEQQVSELYAGGHEMCLPDGVQVAKHQEAATKRRGARLSGGRLGCWSEKGDL